VVRVYDETTRKLIVGLDGGPSGEPGHTSRIFCVKFTQEDPNLVISGGWDNNVKVWDIREHRPIKNIYGPNVCGDSIDLHDGFLLTGSYKDHKQL
jgi:WD40 repeat protein